MLEKIDDFLGCPHCDSTDLQPLGTNNYWRDEEGTTMRTSSRADGTHVSKDRSKPPHGETISILIHCNECLASSALLIKRVEGMVFLSWTKETPYE